MDSSHVSVRKMKKAPDTGPGAWTIGKCDRALKPELGGQHHYAARDHRTLEGAVSAVGSLYGAIDSAHRAGRHIRIRVRKMRVVEQVISAGADGEANSLGNGDVLIQARVDIEIAGSEQCVAAEIAEARFRTCGQEHRLGQARRCSVDSGISAVFGNVSDGGRQQASVSRADVQGALKNISKQRIRKAFRHSGAHEKLTGQGPIAQEVTEAAVAELPGSVPHEIARHVMANIVIGIAIISPDVRVSQSAEELAVVTKLQARAAVGDVVPRVAPGAIDLALEAVRKGPPVLKGQPIVVRDALVGKLGNRQETRIGLDRRQAGEGAPQGRGVGKSILRQQIISMVARVGSHQNVLLSDGLFDLEAPLGI